MRRTKHIIFVWRGVRNVGHAAPAVARECLRACTGPMVHVARSARPYRACYCTYYITLNYVEKYIRRTSTNLRLVNIAYNTVVT